MTLAGVSLCGSTVSLEPGVQESHRHLAIFGYALRNAFAA
jgi:hypothetical protein